MSYIKDWKQNLAEERAERMRQLADQQYEAMLQRIMLSEQEAIERKKNQIASVSDIYITLLMVWIILAAVLAVVLT